jgi:hypothetical protein
MPVPTIRGRVSRCSVPKYGEQQPVGSETRQHADEGSGFDVVVLHRARLQRNRLEIYFDELSNPHVRQKQTQNALGIRCALCAHIA